MKKLIIISIICLSAITASASDFEHEQKTTITKENIKPVLGNILDEAYNVEWNKKETTFNTKTRLFFTKHLNVDLLGHTPLEAEQDWSIRGALKKSNTSLIIEAMTITSKKYDHEILEITSSYNLEKPAFTLKEGSFDKSQSQKVLSNLINLIDNGSKALTCRKCHKNKTE
jgi:hypothetical protein